MKSDKESDKEKELTAPIWIYKIRTLVLMLAVIIGLHYLAEVADQLNWFETQMLGGGEDTTDVGRLVTMSKRGAISVCLGTFWFVLISWILFPFLNIRDAIYGRGTFANEGEDLPRAATILAFALMYLATLIATSMGGK